MKFNEQVKGVLWKLFQDEGYRITEDSENLVIFTSDVQEIRLIHDNYEYSYGIVISNNVGSYPLDDEIVKMVFGSAIPVDQVPRDTLLTNIAHLFHQKEGVDILRVDTGKLEQAVNEYSALYTKALLKKQNLMQADSAWEKGDYRSFIEIMDQMDMSDLLASYRKKYEIAQRTN